MKQILQKKTITINFLINIKLIILNCSYFQTIFDSILGIKL